MIEPAAQSSFGIVAEDGSEYLLIDLVRGLPPARIEAIVSEQREEIRRDTRSKG